MLEVIRIGEIRTYPNSGGRFRQLLLKDTESRLEAVFSFEESRRNWWTYIIEYLNKPEGELKKIPGKIIKHTEKLTDKEISLNIVLPDCDVITNYNAAWQDQYKKVFNYNVLETTKWIWYKK